MHTCRRNHGWLNRWGCRPTVAVEVDLQRESSKGPLDNTNGPLRRALQGLHVELAGRARRAGDREQGCETPTQKLLLIYGRVVEFE